MPGGSLWNTEGTYDKILKKDYVVSLVKRKEIQMTTTTLTNLSELRKRLSSHCQTMGEARLPQSIVGGSGTS